MTLTAESRHRAIRDPFAFSTPMTREQVGRAGRDGNRAVCQTLVSGTDLPLLRSMVYGATPSPAAVSGLLRIVLGSKGDEVDFNFYDLSQVNFVLRGSDPPRPCSIHVNRRLSGFTAPVFKYVMIVANGERPICRPTHGSV